jgi:hypothetical protein
VNSVNSILSLEQTHALKNSKWIVLILKEQQILNETYGTTKKKSKLATYRQRAGHSSEAGLPTTPQL